MIKRYAASLFIFRRDLRLEDNSALNKAIKCSESVLPCFIFDPRQIRHHPYHSKPGLQFMRQSIAELKKAFKAINADLALYDDVPINVVKYTAQEHRIQAVFVNRDYTPFSQMRDDELSRVCQGLNIDFHVIPDYLLVDPELGIKSNGDPYQVFTPFYHNARQFSVSMPELFTNASFIKSEKIDDLLVDALTEIVPNNVAGGRNQALTILNTLEKQTDYQDERDYPALDATSKLSAHLKFGTCSVREAYYAITQKLGTEHPLLRQLYWRDFFTHIAFHYPHVFGNPFHHRYKNLKWDNNVETFNRWCEGTTGFPIVDAGMRELNSTGFMHNRVRMIVASFLTKDLHFNWRWGERYFAQHLVDYDPAVNNGNWQWAASTGCDAQPYFRIFNPWLQQQKFDPECQYIYRWIPELNVLPAKIIHQWYKSHADGFYPAPIVDHAKESHVAKERYKKLT